MAACTNMAACPNMAAYSTPVNTVTREALSVLIANNIMNSSVDFGSDCETMETDSPLRKPNMVPISKKLFHSPHFGGEKENAVYRRSSEKARKASKRRLILLPTSAEKIKKAYVTEYDGDNCGEGMRKKVLISLFHNKEYSIEMECGS